MEKPEEGLESEKECPDCGKSTVIRDYQRSIEICKTCGRVVKEEIKDRGPEWRAFTAEQREERTRGGPPVTQTMHDKGLSTNIDWKNRDSGGKSLSPEKREKMSRLRKWQKRGRISDPADRNLTFSLSEIDRMASQLGVSDSAKEIACKKYREAVEEGLVRGRSMEGCATAMLYAACRKARVPRSLDEVSEVSRVGKKEVGRTYRFIARELDIDLPPTDPARYVARFSSRLDVPGRARVRAMEIIKEAREENLTIGKNPSGTAAAAIYIAAMKEDEKRTQREVADAADVTEVTVRNRYREIADGLGIELDV